MSIDFNGDIRINCVNSNIPGKYNYISIEIQDNLSGTHVMNIECSMEQFATALFNRGGVCKCSIVQTQNINKVRENKIEFVKVPKKLQYKQLTELLAKHEVDGWVARRDDIGNSHCSKPGGYMVSFSRFV